MQAAQVDAGGIEFSVYQVGASRKSPGVELVWGHGWGHSHQQFLALAQSVAHLGPSWLIDFPGFGASPPPPGAWGSAEYADAIAAWLGGRTGIRRIWIGHSFGGRVGLELAARHPALVDGLFLVASAGLPRRRSGKELLRFKARTWSYKAARAMLPEGRGRDWLRARFGSADYRSAGPLRSSLVKIVGEDLSEAARSVRCPMVLLYGDRDSDTPPEIGQRLKALVPQAELYILRGYDHHDILTRGRHQVLQRLSEFASGIAG